MALALKVIRLSDIHVEGAALALREKVGNQRYLVGDITGLTPASLRMLAHLSPVVVTIKNDCHVPIANLRTLSLLKTGLPESEEVPVLVVEPLDNEDDWAIMDTLIVPMLRTLDPASSADQLDTVFLGLSPARVKSFWRGAHTSAGLARLLGIARLQLYRSRKGKTDQTQTDEVKNT